jgi:nicotinate-nucleotide pyrophosphorylase (carboxylating)
MRIPPHLISRVAAEALMEDLGPGDVTTESIVPADLRGMAEIVTREPVVASGADVAVAAFVRLDPGCRVEMAAEEGARIASGGDLLRVAGRARALLSGERTALNFLGRLCGIATYTSRFVEACNGRRIEIADTRKTTPTLRLLEKRAVAAGGGANHRMGLYDAFLIKDNHVDVAGGIANAIARARAGSPPGTPVEVEVRSLSELDEALECGAEAVLIDNMSGEQLREAVGRVRGRALVEVSGGVRLEAVPMIAALGVERISIGAITHSVPAADLTMRIKT